MAEIDCALLLPFAYQVLVSISARISSPLVVDVIMSR